MGRTEIKKGIETKTIFLFILLTFVFTSPILFSGHNLGIQDWDISLAYLESARKSVIEYKQFPLWNPYHCGGMPSFGNPQSNIISLNFLFVLIFGTVLGVKISIFFHFLINIIGFYFLSKALKISKKASILASIIYGFNGVLSSSLGTGMLSFLAISYLPWVLFFYFKSEVNKNRIIFIILSAIFLSLSFYEGYHSTLIFLPLIFLISFTKSIKEKKALFIRNFFWIIILFFIFSLPKLALSIDLISIFSRKIIDDSGYTLHNFFYFLFSRKQNYHGDMGIINYGYNTDENSLYVGFLPVYLFLLGMMQLFSKKNLFWIIIILINMILMFGNNFPVNFFSILKKLPFYDSFRVAERFRFNFIMIFSLICGFGFDFILNNLKGIMKNLVYLLVLVVIFINLFYFSKSNFFDDTFAVKNSIINTTEYIHKGFFSIDNNIVQNTIDSKATKLPQYYQGKPVYVPWSNEYLLTKNNIGSIDCYESIPISISAKGIDQRGYKGEAYLLNKSGKVKIEYWSPNLINIKVNSLNREKDLLVINQNFNHGWFVKIDKVIYRVKNYKGLISFPVDNNKKKINFFYNPFQVFYEKK
jgi:hypothetical protein